MRAKQLDILNNLIDTDINIDVVRIRIAVENIVHNALKYARERVDLEIYSDEKNVVISVKDDGKGIEMDRTDINLRNLIISDLN